MCRRWGLLLVALSSIAVLMCVTGAWAEGGQAIAGAPTIGFGQQEFGNLNNGDVTQNSCSDNVYTEWWLLPVTAGDQVAIDWEAQQLQYSAIEIYPVGTTDYTYPTTNTAVDQELNSNGKNQASFTATVSGTMPVAFTSSDYSCLNGTPGPYDFTAYVTHALVVSLPPLSRLLAGTVAVGVHNPDGAPLSGAPLVVTLEVSRNATAWTTVGSATPANGIASLAYRIPPSLADSKVAFRAVAAGAGYVTTASTTETVSLPAEAACIVPALLHLPLRYARAHLKQAHCALGVVFHRRAQGANRGHVIAQSSPAGAHLPNRTRISVTVGS